MDKSTIQLLELLSAAMGTKEGIDDIPKADWNKLFSMAHIHNVIPMVYEIAEKTQSFAGADPNLSGFWRQLAINQSLSQMYRTMDFLQVYDKLNQAGIRALVVKGIICRGLYPNPNSRSSGDEDVFIQREDFEQVDVIFREAGLIRDKNKNWDNSLEQVTTYRSMNHGLVIELHVDLFPSDWERFASMNELFAHAFDTAVTVMVDCVSIHTLSHNLHLLFLILHCIKHFLTTGFGIRQVCDLVLYINANGQQADWTELWNLLSKMGYEVLFLNLLDIGRRYLGLEEEQFQNPHNVSLKDIHSEALLEDIMKSGIFGKSQPGQVKSSSMTLRELAVDSKTSHGRNAVKNKSNNHDRNQSKNQDSNQSNYQGKNPGRISIIIRSVFPGLNYMKSHYPYCSKYPMLLPVAWIHRMILYAWEEKNLHSMIRKAGSSFDIGRQRIELLKEYRIIGR